MPRTEIVRIVSRLEHRARRVGGMLSVRVDGERRDIPELRSLRETRAKRRSLSAIDPVRRQSNTALARNARRRVGAPVIHDEHVARADPERPKLAEEPIEHTRKRGLGLKRRDDDARSHRKKKVVAHVPEACPSPSSATFVLAADFREARSHEDFRE